jgi:hypothetical protein
MKQDGSEEIEMAILQDLKLFRKQQEKDSKTIGQALEKIDAFNEKLTSMKALPLETDLSPVKELIEEQNLRILAMIAAIPKAIKREYHFHFFPKLNIKEYYQTYNRLFLYGTIFLLATGLVNIGLEWIKGYNQRQDNLEQIEALKQYEENELQFAIKKNKSKLAASSQSTEAQKLKAANNKITLSKKKIMDSFKMSIEKKVSLLVNDTLRK